jgi:hypothetical protein
MSDTRYTPEVGQLRAHVVAEMKEKWRSPCCDAPLVNGPRGGACINCWCEACHARFNILVDHPVNWGQCTDTKDDYGFAWYGSRGGKTLYDVAREVCHEHGMPWTDPRSGITYPPPKKEKN